MSLKYIPLADAAERSGLSPAFLHMLEHEEIIARDRLTTLMVTHSMHQAANLGDRLIMMHCGQIIHDFRGVEKRRLRVDDLLARFEEVRRADLLDEIAAELLERTYV